VSPPEGTTGELVFDRYVDDRRCRVIARIDDGGLTARWPVDGRLLLRASQPLRPTAARIGAVTSNGPNAVVVQLAAD
jgi:hypothetical protein